MAWDLKADEKICNAERIREFAIAFLTICKRLQDLTSSKNVYFPCAFHNRAFFFSTL